MLDENGFASVIRFEQAVKTKDYEQACAELLGILAKIDSNFGGFQNIECDFPSQLANLEQDKAVHFCTRVATAITQLFVDPDFMISDVGTLRFLAFQRWIGLIFASSPYVNADHVLQTYNRNAQRESISEIFLEDNRAYLNKFCILYLPESNITLNLDALWDIDPELCVSLCFALQSPRVLHTEQAYAKRAAILQWLPEKLLQISSLNNLPTNIAHDVYMHCSYDAAPNKHQVKKALNDIIRRHLLSLGWEDRDVQKMGSQNGKPVMVVLLEHFHSSHAIYRAYSASLTAAKAFFHIIGLSDGDIDQTGREVFDEFYLLNGNHIIDRLEQIKDLCERNGAAIFYMPSIGMDITSICASNARFAPIQVVGLGHPATTNSSFIDYAIVEDDYVGLEQCFSESLLRLPTNALPYVPVSPQFASTVLSVRDNPDVVNIGIALTTMQLNPYFLDVCKAIYERANVEIRFHFICTQSIGITQPYVERFISSYLGDSAVSYPYMPYEQYQHILSRCDMVLYPFPFSTVSGAIEMATFGLVGVCKTGNEVHEHLNQGVFKRLGLPEWLVAENVDQYVERAVRLAENHQERIALRHHISDSNVLQTLFNGEPSQMGLVLLQKLAEWAEQNHIEFAFSIPAKKRTTRKAAKVSAKKAEDNVTAKPAKKSVTKTKSEPKKAETKKANTKKKASPLKEAAEQLKKKEKK